MWPTVKALLFESAPITKLYSWAVVLSLCWFVGAYGVYGISTLLSRPSPIDRPTPSSGTNSQKSKTDFWYMEQDSTGKTGTQRTLKRVYER